MVLYWDHITNNIYKPLIIRDIKMNDSKIYFFLGNFHFVLRLVYMSICIMTEISLLIFNYNNKKVEKEVSKKNFISTIESELLTSVYIFLSKKVETTRIS